MRAVLSSGVDAVMLGRGPDLAFDGLAAASEEGFEVRARWEKELARGGWLGIGFPEQYGGRGASITEPIVFAHECT